MGSARGAANVQEKRAKKSVMISRGCSIFENVQEKIKKVDSRARKTKSRRRRAAKKFLTGACTIGPPSLHYKHVEDMAWAIGGLTDSDESPDYMLLTS